jgi:hypothetical protein
MAGSAGGEARRDGCWRRPLRALHLIYTCDGPYERSPGVAGGVSHLAPVPCASESVAAGGAVSAAAAAPPATASAAQSPAPTGPPPAADLQRPSNPSAQFLQAPPPAGCRLALRQRGRARSLVRCSRGLRRFRAREGLATLARACAPPDMGLSQPGQMRCSQPLGRWTWQ